MEQVLSPSVCIKQSPVASGAIVSLLKSTLWGTPGLTQYQHLETEKTIYDIGSPVFYSLERQGNLLCTVCLAGREVNIGSKARTSHYVRYLAVRSGLGGDGKRKQKPGKSHSGGLVKQFMEEVFRMGPSALFHRPEQKALYYAYVESENEQSIHLCTHFGFRKVSTMDTVPFSRFSPKKHTHVRRADPLEYASIQERILQQYHNHNLIDLEHVFYEENYFVAEADGKIVAGVQANPMCWAFRNLPGLSGRILLRVLPRIPYLRRLINPQRFSFSAFEGVFCLDGHEGVLNSLFESVLALQGNYTALIWMDTKSPMIQTIRKHCHLGLMDKINSGGAGDILVRGENLTPADWESLIGKPAYVSCFDFN
ncbi:MAG TPA: hypothetical protein PLK12_08340 [Prolixibacteraceae bacterium]|nr:hypothetical protein [Prolixibacteraceae bacterium]